MLNYNHVKLVYILELIGWFKISSVTGFYRGSCLDEHIYFSKLEAGIS